MDGIYIAVTNDKCAYVGAVSRAKDDLITFEAGCTFHYRIGGAWTTLVCRGEENIRVPAEYTIMHGKDFCERNSFMHRDEQRKRVRELRQKEDDLAAE
jgi:hypothetical protein